MWFVTPCARSTCQTKQTHVCPASNRWCHTDVNPHRRRCHAASMTLFYHLCLSDIWVFFQLWQNVVQVTRLVITLAVNQTAFLLRIFHLWLILVTSRCRFGRGTKHKYSRWSLWSALLCWSFTKYAHFVLYYWWEVVVYTAEWRKNLLQATTIRHFRCFV